MMRHAHHRRRIPLRIHVNGSRGKSSVTRLIAAGLRAGGIRTLAKTTGSAACLIHPDGSESPVWRRGAPNIREQLRMFRRAVAEGAEALVLECMAIRPDLQRVCEERIVDSTLGVITNVRPDHLEIMGPRLEDVAASLAGTVPRRGRLLTSETAFAGYLEQRARSLGSSFTLARAEEVTSEDLAGFTYVEFPENVSLALAVCAAAGVERRRALAGMRGVRPDVGALTRWRRRERGKEIEFINAFAANDPISYLRIWDHLDLAARAAEIVLLLNVRGDRQRRSQDLAPLCGRELQASHYVLIGTETFIVHEMLRRQGLPAASVTNLGGRSAAEIWERVVELAGPRCLAVGIGNIGGVGRDLLELLVAREAQG
jgi:poly-gamma-glutamate synthase PgsB/CapB